MAPDHARLDRRAFLRVAGSTAGVLATGGIASLTACDDAVPPIAPSLRRTVATTRYPIRVPPVIGGSAGLTAQSSVIDFGGLQSPAWSYNGFLPAPTVRVQRGDNASLVLTNSIPHETTIHWHGMLVPTAADGHPMHAVPPGGSYAYQFPVIQRAGTNWYHPHPHGMTGEQVYRGLAGFFIVSDAEEAALGLPSGMYDVPLVVRDASFDGGGTLQYSPKHGGFEGNTGLVNGVRNAKLDVDTTLYRFRLLNGANARIFRLYLSNGAPFVIIGNDGGLLDAPVSVTQLTMGPGERIDVLLDFSSLAVGSTVMLKNAGSGGDAMDLLQFAVARRVTTTGTIPTSLSTIAKLSAAEVAVTRTFSFDGMSRINGREFDMHRIDLRVPFGQVERWRFTTAGNAPHPVHVHGASFQVESRTGGRGTLYPWERGWKDTVLLEDGETVDVLIQFTAYRGVYLLHCHKLEHEDMGMMLNFEVV